MTKHYLLGLFNKSANYSYAILSLLAISVLCFLSLFYTCIKYNNMNIYVLVNIDNIKASCNSNTLENAYSEENSITIPLVLSILNIILYLLTILFGLLTSFSNPGYLRPKNFNLTPYEMNKTIPVIIKGRNFKLKYCYTCFLIRSPFISHCKKCNVCIDRYDHHCPWLGTCIGRLNYKSFMHFLFAMGLHLIFIIVSSSIKLGRLNDFISKAECDNIKHTSDVGIIYFLIVSSSIVSTN